MLFRNECIDLIFDSGMQPKKKSGKDSDTEPQLLSIGAFNNVRSSNYMYNPNHNGPLFAYL